MLDRARQHGTAEDEGWRVRKDGSRFWANVVITALWDDAGELKGFAKVTRDITERRQAEDALREAREQAVAANLAKTEFLSRTSHELRTPMSSILGFAQVLELDLDKFEDTQKVAISQILKAGRHLLSLITDLLDISSIEAGGADLKLQVFDLRDVLSEAHDLSAPLIKSAGLEFQYTPPETPIPVSGDRRRIVQVALNILTNAAKYNRNGEWVRLTVSVDQDIARVEIMDDGPGISDADIPRLFTPFDRLGKQRVKGVQGTGLGLALSKRLVETMKGEIGYRRRETPEHGSIFWFTLKLAEYLHFEEDSEGE